MIGKLMCKLGLHSTSYEDKWTPSITAKVVTDFEQTHTCRRCKKITAHTHIRWNGSEFREV